MFRSLNIASVKRRPSAWITLPNGDRHRGMTRIAFQCGCKCEMAGDWMLSIRICGWRGTTADGARICPTTDWASLELVQDACRRGRLTEVA